jgi:hypothetical protein
MLLITLLIAKDLNSFNFTFGVPKPLNFLDESWKTALRDASSDSSYEFWSASEEFWQMRNSVEVHAYSIQIWMMDKRKCIALSDYLGSFRTIGNGSIDQADFWNFSNSSHTLYSIFFYISGFFEILCQGSSGRVFPNVLEAGYPIYKLLRKLDNSMGAIFWR